MPAPPPADAAALRELLEGDVVDAARGLLGCRIAVGGTIVEIVETEAYHEDEEACHGYRGRTPRAAKLRRPPGSSYVYLSYGIHRLLNVVTGSQAVASAVLIRGAIAVDDPGRAAGLAGPGRLAASLGIDLPHDGLDLLRPESAVRLLPATAPRAAQQVDVLAGPRIGITKAVELPWRFAVAGSPGVSRPRPAGWPTARR